MVTRFSRLLMFTRHWLFCYSGGKSNIILCKTCDTQVPKKHPYIDLVEDLNLERPKKREYKDFRMQSEILERGQHREIKHHFTVMEKLHNLIKQIVAELEAIKQSLHLVSKPSKKCVKDSLTGIDSG